MYPLHRELMPHHQDDVARGVLLERVFVGEGFLSPDRVCVCVSME